MRRKNKSAAEFVKERQGKFLVLWKTPRNQTSKHPNIHSIKEAAMRSFASADGETATKPDHASTTSDIHLELLFDGTHDAINVVEVTEDGRFLYQAVNPCYLEVTGLNREDMIGKTPVEIHGSETGGHIEGKLRRCLEECQKIQYNETIFLTGEVRMAMVKLTPVIKGGLVQQIISSTRDLTIQKRAELHLEVQKKNLEALFTNSSDAIVFFDGNHHILDINQRFVEVFGYTLAEIIGRDLDDVITRPGVRQEAGTLTHQLMSGNPVAREVVRYHKDGTGIDVFVKGLAVEVGGRITGGYGIYTDISYEKKAKDALRASEERWQFALEGSGNGVWDWDIETNEFYYSDQYLSILGYQRDDLDAKYDTFRSMVHPDDQKALIQAYEQHTALETEVMKSEHRMRCADGSWKWVMSQGKNMGLDPSGKPTRMVGTISDIAERKIADNEIRYLSFHDKLTGLYNRAFFEEEMRRIDCPRSWPLSIILGDANDLKTANDLYGHHIGDQLLVRIAEILMESCRQEDVIARWGGDEFAILLPKTQAGDALEVSKRISNLCAEFQALPVKLSISLGTATKEDQEQGFEALFRKAELEMYEQKVQFYHGDHRRMKRPHQLTEMDSLI
jgi:diguanylate cyclase (GGDEF)-like protein/PAS domain S-box-containing protein